MLDFIPVLVLLSVVVVSLLVVRVATVALVLTGLSRDVARFEARSAFTGGGYTSSQTELVMTHPVRRQIVMTLMLLGSAGHVTVISSLIFSVFGGPPGSDQAVHPIEIWLRVAAILAGLGLLWIFGHSAWVDVQITRVITSALQRFTQLEVIDYVGLLRLSGGYEVAELLVTSDSWLVNKSLSELRLTDENVLVLGVHQTDGTYVGTPPHGYVLREHQNLILYGPNSVIQDIDRRPSGAAGRQAHLDSVQSQIVDP